MEKNGDMPTSILDLDSNQSPSGIVANSMSQQYRVRIDSFSRMYRSEPSGRVSSDGPTALTGAQGEARRAREREKELVLHKCANHDNTRVIADHTLDHVCLVEGEPIRLVDSDDCSRAAHSAQFPEDPS